MSRKQKNKIKELKRELRLARSAVVRRKHRTAAAAEESPPSPSPSSAATPRSRKKLAGLTPEVAAFAATPSQSRVMVAEMIQRSFRAAQPMPGVVPTGHAVMANDAAIKQATEWACGALDEACAAFSSFGQWPAAVLGPYGAFREGMAFLGYPMLSELAQRPEYRVIVETIATEMTRQGIKIKSSSDAKLVEQQHAEALARQPGAPPSGLSGLGHSADPLGAKKENPFGKKDDGEKAPPFGKKDEDEDSSKEKPDKEKKEPAEAEDAVAMDAAPPFKKEDEGDEPKQTEKKTDEPGKEGEEKETGTKGKLPAVEPVAGQQKPPALPSQRIKPPLAGAGPLPKLDPLTGKAIPPVADKSRKIKELEDELQRLRVMEHLRRVAEQDGFFGRAHLYIDVNDDAEKNPGNLIQPIGDGKNDISKVRVTKGSLKRLQVVEAVWTYPTNYNSIDPLRPDWYRPDVWFVMGRQVHSSRLLQFIGREVPDMLKPAYSFGGLSMTQMARPYVDNWLRTRQSVSDLVYSFSVFVLSTNLGETLTPGGQDLITRAKIFTDMRDNKGVMMVDKDTEEFANVTTSLASLPELQAQAQEHMASVSRIPLVKLTGISPTGLNASSEGEIRTFYDFVHAYQEKFFRPNLDKVFHLAQLNLWGEVDEDLSYEFEPLWSLDEKATAEVQKIKADTAAVLIDAGVIDSAEDRERVARDPETDYPSLDLSKVIEPPNFGEPMDNPFDPEGDKDGKEGEKKDGGHSGPPTPPGGGKKGPGIAQGGGVGGSPAASFSKEAA